MDVSYSKQAVAGIAAPRKRSVTALKEISPKIGSRDGTAQFCSRIGCCGRLNPTKGTKNKCLEKPKPLKSSFRSSSGKEVAVAGPSKNCPSVKKPLVESEKKPSSKVETETIPTESSSSVSDESEIQELNASASRKERKLKSRNTTAGGKTTEAPIPSSGTRIRKVSAPTQITDFRVVEKGQNGKNVLKSLRCNSMLDGSYRQKDPNGELNSCGKRSVVKKRFTQGESSSSAGKGKRVGGVLSANEGHSRNWTACRANGGGSSVRTRRSMKADPSAGSVNNRLHGDGLSLVRSTNGSSVTESGLNGGHSSNDDSSAMVSVASTDRHHPVVRVVNQNGTRHYNIDGVADVLLALDRIEQDEELTYEQLLSLEANLFLGGLNFYDQHRDMRLDIDNMSYEELLVLEEKMGTVSTALSEDEISKCIRTSIYESLELEDERMRGADDSKCSICQEEFVRGDEIGKVVGCGHGYHTPCINQWLRLKNWCPICKASPQSSSSS